MNWDKNCLEQVKWCGDIAHYDQKLSLAKQMALKVKDGDVIGFGSGSTSFLIVNEIARHVRENALGICAIPTSPEIALTCQSLSIPVESLNHVRPDWSFDGADEVDGNRNLIKGRGGAMFIEKLLMRCSAKTYIVVDQSKQVDTLGEKFPIPVEIAPESLVYVRQQLHRVGAHEAVLRLAKAKDGPVVTASGNYILDARFASVYQTLEKDIKAITGVVESGLFIGYDVEIVTVG